VRWVTAIALLAGSSAAVAAPANVRVVSPSNQGAAPSPDGTMFLYQRRGDLVVGDVDTGKPLRRLRVPPTRCTSSYCEGVGVTAYAWAPNSREVAYAVSTGTDKTGLYVYDLNRRATRRVSKAEVRQLGYGATGGLFYLVGVGQFGTSAQAELWRDRGRAPAFRLPDRAGRRLGSDGQQHIVGRRWILTSVRRRNAYSYLELAEAWLTDVATGKAHRLPIPAAAVGLTLSPDETRVCYFAARALHCLELGSGRDTVVAAANTCGYSRNMGAAWSPSGGRLAFPRCRGGRRDLMIYDFAGGTTRLLAPDTPYDTFAFQTDDYLLLLSREMGDHWGHRYAMVGRVDVATARRYALIVDVTSYPHAMPVPGRADRLLLARDRGGTTDLAWVDTSRPIGPDPTRPPPTNGDWTGYHANGKPRVTLHFSHGVRNGTARWFDWNGRRIAAGQYRAGKPRGIWTSWRPNGRKDKIVEHADNGAIRTLWWYRWKKQP